ncbi:hypothetical protein AURDEDRAFT_125431 [Auricularia subglabra TFB-10046 SS5]|nr:hypothetical protein AURDEDRAFT_125431 [Auricularia subglabra TFB-10046 SS5]
MLAARLVAISTVLLSLLSVTLGKDPVKNVKNPRTGHSGSTSSSSTSQLTRAHGEGDYRPPTRIGLDQTPREPRPHRQAAETARSNVQAALAPHEDSEEDSQDSDSSVILVGTTGGHTPAAPAHELPAVGAGPHLRTASEAAPPAQAANPPSTPPAPPAPAPPLPPPGPVNPLDLDDPPYYAPPPDTPERVGRRHLLLNTAPPSLEFYARSDPESNNTDIYTVDRLIDQTLHPRFVFDRMERARIFDQAVDDIERVIFQLRLLELKTNAHAVLHIGLPDDYGGDDSRLCRLLTSRVIDGNDAHRSIAQRLSDGFRRHIANLRHDEVQETLELARQEEDERIADREERKRRHEKAQRDMEAAMAANRAARSLDQPVAAKRQLSSPSKHNNPTKKRKDTSKPPGARGNSSQQKAPSSSKPGSTTSSSKGKGKGKAVDMADLHSHTSNSADVFQGAPPPPPLQDPRRFGSVVPSSEPGEDEDDAEYLEAVKASLKSTAADDARRRGEPIASSSRLPPDDSQPGSSSSARADHLAPSTDNALTQRAAVPRIHRPDPVLPDTVIPLLAQLGVAAEYWPAIEVVWRTSRPAVYADALITVAANCGLRLSIVDIYNLAALLARKPPPQP